MTQTPCRCCCCFVLLISALIYQVRRMRFRFYYISDTFCRFSLTQWCKILKAVKSLRWLGDHCYIWSTIRRSEVKWAGKTNHSGRRYFECQPHISHQGKLNVIEQWLCAQTLVCLLILESYVSGGKYFNPLLYKSELPHFDNSMLC